MPSSAQSAFSASARLSVDCAETDREPARGNVFPSYVHDDRRPPARALRLDCDTRAVDRDEVAFDDGLRLAASIANVHSLTVETLVVLFPPERSFRSWRRDLEVVGSGDQLRVVEQRSDDFADTLAVLDLDRLGPVDGDPQGAPALTRL